ncbi:MAG: methyltransferase domain-containing protein [Thermoplasmata archaeon]|nr:methyltransferase domain-containing protein [Thermoplasmata archaeon]
MDGELEHLRLRGPRGVIPLGFVAEGEALFLIARERSAQWPVDALRTGSIEVELPEGRRRGDIRLLASPSDRTTVLEHFRAKYGDAAFQRWYEHPARILRVDLLPRGGEQRPRPGGYDGWLESEFDNVADEYDRHITGNRMNMLLRNRSLAQLRPTFSSAHRLLEVGCGSGMETLPLLRDGHEIVVVDVSQRMLDVVQEKARREGLGEQLSARKLRAAELGRLVESKTEEKFDGAYSTYGALNCEPDLRAVPGAFADLVRPGGRLILGIYNRWCLFEVAGYLLALQPRRAFGRRRNPIPVGASRFCIDVYAYSAGEIRHMFSPGFTAERLEGVPVWLPPSDLTSYAEKLSGRFEQLAAIDSFVGRRWPWRSLGDHFLLTLRRRAPDSAS